MKNAHGGMLMTFADMAWGHVVSGGPFLLGHGAADAFDFLSSAHMGDWVEGSWRGAIDEDDLFVVRGRV
ncbi:MAG: hotdog domain-containing protein [Hyphomonadaceae bacterium]